MTKVPANMPAFFMLVFKNEIQGYLFVHCISHFPIFKFSNFQIFHATLCIWFSATFHESGHCVSVMSSELEQA
jgi:hypothetical protein